MKGIHRERLEKYFEAEIGAAQAPLLAQAAVDLLRSGDLV
jgi:hypothetical protein